MPFLPHLQRFDCSLSLARRCGIAIVGALLLSPYGHAQNVNLVPVRKTPQAIARYDENTQWSLQLKHDAIISSPLLRLRDVAVPIESNPPWWDRAGASIIGLMPLNEHEMIVERSRLMEAVARSTSIPQIRWFGATEVRVIFRRPVEKTPTAIQTVSAENVIKSAPAVAIAKTQELPLMPPSERDRIIRLIQIGIDRYDSQLRESFDITIDPNQEGIKSLREFRRIDLVTWEAAPTEGMNLAKVDGMNPREPISAMIEVSFAARPLVVVAKEAFRKGHILSESDLLLLPAARNVPISEVLTDMNDAIGLQVQSVIQKERPVSRTAVGPVIVVERGDLVEVRVMGGGITIATGAKTLAPGAKGDLIAVETLDPKRKLMARVAGPGVVEIITRPPRVQ